MIDEEEKLSINKSCNILDVSRDGFYKWKNREPVSCNRNDNILRKEICRIALEFPFYGYRKITKELFRRKIVANHKKVRKIMREENIQCRRKKKKYPVTTDSNHNYKIYPNLAKGLKVTGLNQLWVSDITYIRLARGGFVFLAVMMDVFSRKVIGWALSTDIDSFLTIKALNMAIKKRKKFGFDKLIHHSDRGVQYACKLYIGMLKELAIKVSMSEAGNPYDNAFAERLIKTIKEEEVYIQEYETLEEAYRNIKRFIELVYNKKRIHSSIDYVTPEEYEQEVLIKVKNRKVYKKYVA